MKFKEWLQLQEVGTGTNAIALFASPMGGGFISRRVAPKLLVADSDEEKEKKSKKKIDPA